MDVGWAVCDTSAGIRDHTMLAASARQAAFAAIALWSASALMGCAPVNLRGQGFGDESAIWGQKLRPTMQPGSLAGADNRAREIEQNLGVR
jgi:hypothetical protein